LIAADTSGAQASDDYTACSAQPGNAVPGQHPPTSGAVGQPGDPYHVPYLLDTYATTDARAGLCLRAGVVGRRLAFEGASAFEEDLVIGPPPARAAWPGGLPSSVCETAATGTRAQLVNAVVSETQVWITARQSGSKAELCFRAGGTGGRLTLDASASPGVTPVLEPARSDLAGCTKTEFHDDPNRVHLRRSETGAGPASVCLTVGSSTVRFTVGVAGSPGVPPAATFERDA
jgi:hypothetical protein